MKKTYVRPTMVGETFTTEDFFATCENSQEWEYKFVCDAPAADTVYQETNGTTGLQSSGYNKDKKIVGWGSGLSNYHPCGATHTVKVPVNTPASSVFSIGYANGGTYYLWRGEGNNNCHLMVAADPTIIEIPVVKS